MFCRLAFLFFFATMLCLGLARAGDEVAREDLFRRAFRSAGFIMVNAGSDASFIKSLTPKEATAFYQLANATHLANLRAWIMEQKIHNFSQNPNEEVFAYVMAQGNAGVKIIFNLKGELTFSNDEKMFRLQPGQPDRTAVTTSEPRSDIFINLKLISRPEFEISFPDAVALAVHEFGNKLGTVRDQASIDSVAAKIQRFTEQKTKKFETPQGTLSVTTFEDISFEDLLQSSVMRTAGAAPGSLSKIYLSGDQGLYIFFENDKGVTDLTSDFIKPLQAASLKPEPSGMPYAWHKIFNFSATFPQLRQVSEGKFQFEMNVQKFWAAIPFGIASSPEPTVYKPWQKVSSSASYKSAEQNRISWTLDFSGARPKLIQTKKTPMVLEDPAVTIEKISSVRTENEHVLTYKVPNTYKIQGFITGFQVQPILKLKVEEEILEIFGRRSPTTPDHFEFHIPPPARSSTVEVLGLEATGTEGPSMTASEVVRVKFLLPGTETLQFAPPASTGPSRFALKSLQLWDGSKWSSLKHGSGPATRGSHLRFIFDSDSKLLSLSLLESYLNLTRITAEAPPLDPIRFNQVDPVNDRLIEIPEKKLKQTLIGNKLIVDWQVDQDIPLINTYRAAMDPKVFIQMAQSGGGLLFASMIPPKATQEIVSEVIGKRRLSAVEAINSGLEKATSQFSTPLEFEKIASANSPVSVTSRLESKTANQTSKQKACEGLLP